jgi:hypothetical protein
MDIAPFNAPVSARSLAEVVRIREGLDEDARHFVYKLYDASDGRPMQWHPLYGMRESAAAISRAVQRGWVVLQDARGKPLERKVALTDDGRRLARMGR